MGVLHRKILVLGNGKPEGDNGARGPFLQPREWPQPDQSSGMLPSPMGSTRTRVLRNWAIRGFWMELSSVMATMIIAGD